MDAGINKPPSLLKPFKTASLKDTFNDLLLVL